jgi:hypothetical protein
MARSFWEQFHTEFLWGWARDYKDAPALAPDNRDALLHFLTTADGVERPEEGDEEKQLVQAWKRCIRKFKRAGTPQPPVLLAAAAEADAALSPATPEGTPPMGQPSPPSPLLLSLSAAAAVPPRADPPSALRPPAAARFSLSSALQMQPLPPSPAAAAAGTLPPPTTQKCKSCARHVPADPPPEPFFCPHCQTRGDLEWGHEQNVKMRDALEREALARAGQVAPSASASSASSQGQFSITAPKLSRLDQEFARMAAHGRDQPLFVGAAAATPWTFEQAVQAVQRAYGASASQAPSAQMVNLVRAGKLRHVGFATPQPLQGALAGDAKVKGRIGFADDDTVVLSSVASKPAEVNSASSFCLALFATILPALIDRPAALSEWLTLGRTALALDEKFGWKLAMDYVDRQLARSIDAGAPFAAAVDSGVLTELALAGIGRSQQHSSGASGPSSSARKERGTCHRFNGDGCSQSAAACIFLHSCSNCSSADHGAKACPRGERGRRPPLSGSSVSTKQSHVSRHSRAGGGGGGGGAPAAGASAAAPNHA